MNKETREYLNLQRRLAIFKYAKAWGNVTKACLAFAMPRAFYYKLKKAYDAEGESGLVRKRPIVQKHPRELGTSSEEKLGKYRETISHNWKGNN